MYVEVEYSDIWPRLYRTDPAVFIDQIERNGVPDQRLILGIDLQLVEATVGFEAVRGALEYRIAGIDTGDDLSALWRRRALQ